ncbi:MAG TPA: O-antigen ligase family protein [Bryobacteraceae bacterium]|nr:O-antigen ligase family protein [Bryobacteraceae bacterium]
MASASIPQESWLLRAAFWLAGASAVTVVFSIAASQILLALATAALLLSPGRLRLPPLRLPLALFLAATLVSLALSGDVASGRPQIRKFFVFLMLPAVYSTFRRTAHARALILAWVGAAAVAALRGLAQFSEKLLQARLAGANFYDYYVAERISGFMSHWMTFSGQLMIVFLLAASFLLFSPSARRGMLLYAGLCSAATAAALLLGFTRSIWLATACALAFLLWRWRRWAAAALPALLLTGVLAAPGSVRTRFVSMFRPRQDVDSNQHRIVCWRTGWRMIQAHPWFGLGPEQVRLQFVRWVPRDIPWPLPTGWYGHLHSIYVHYAAERGLPAMFALVWLLAKILWDFLAAVRKLPPGPSEEKFLLHGGIAVVIAVLIEGIFELNLGDSEVLALFLAAVAAVYAARDRVVAQEAGLA